MYPEQAQPIKQKKNLKLPIILMVWPIISILIAIILYATVNFISGSVQPTPAADTSNQQQDLLGAGNSSTDTNASAKQQDLFGNAGIVHTATNVILFLVGALSVGLGPISFVVGLVLLIQRLSKK